MAEFQPEARRVPARIFTAEEELPFAGHPVIGAAAALHELWVCGPVAPVAHGVVDKLPD